MTLSRTPLSFCRLPCCLYLLLISLVKWIQWGDDAAPIYEAARVGYRSLALKARQPIVWQQPGACSTGGKKCHIECINNFMDTCVKTRYTGKRKSCDHVIFFWVKFFLKRHRFEKLLFSNNTSVNSWQKSCKRIFGAKLRLQYTFVSYFFCNFSSTKLQPKIVLTSGATFGCCCFNNNNNNKKQCWFKGRNQSSEEAIFLFYL